MDKNMVSIDNLVRQRLGGEEEKERDGAWLHMRDLLDKEMPQNKPVGMIFWRRALTFAGLVLLTGSAGFGGYKMYSHANIASGDNQNVATVVNNATSVTAPSTNNDGVNSASATSATKQAAANNNSLQNSLNSTDKKQSKAHTVTAPLAVNTVTKNAAKTAIAKHNTIAKANIAGNAEKADVSTSANNTVAKTTTDNKTNATTPKQSQKDVALAVNTEGKNNTSNSKNTAQTNKSMIVAAAIDNSNPNKANAAKIKREALRKIAAANSAKSGKNGVEDNSASLTSDDENKPSGNRRVINKVVLNKRFVRDEYNNGYFVFDTISKEKLLEQLQAINETVETATEPKTDVLNNAVASNDPAAGSANNLHDLSAAPSLKSVHESKANTSKRGSGSRLVENLSAAFNDIKNTSSEVKFTPGLTVGTNGTFFGPASFYGFHFGVTGSLNFGDNFSIVSELKYVHRINSDYQMNDDYYVYESNNGGGGGYKKSKLDYDFSFSTLHSFELPISFKYNINNFSVFAGANFVYTFGISTGAVALPDPNYQTQIVATKGNDDHATLSYADFGQRFGIGYLFGLSFKVSPSVAFDLRTVQTMWDNVKTDGARAVSNTLYKTPSLQLSLNYRLGAPKKDMDK